MRWRELGTGFGRERENLDSDITAKVTSGKNHEDESADAESRDGRARSSSEVSVMETRAKGFYRLRRNMGQPISGRNS